ncbi:unnamed protein product, partial [Urochloa humidicola]
QQSSLFLPFSALPFQLGFHPSHSNPTTLDSHHCSSPSPVKDILVLTVPSSGQNFPVDFCRRSQNYLCSVHLVKSRRFCWGFSSRRRHLFSCWVCFCSPSLSSPYFVVTVSPSFACCTAVLPSFASSFPLINPIAVAGKGTRGGVDDGGAGGATGVQLLPLPEPCLPPRRYHLQGLSGKEWPCVSVFSCYEHICGT